MILLSTKWSFERSLMIVTLTQMQTTITEVQKKLLTSNDITPRSEQPYYYNHPSVPPTLTEFKRIVTEIRIYAARLIHELGVQHAGSVKQDFTEGKVFHSLLLGLVTSSFGIGECAESMYKLAELLIKQGCHDFLFISLALPASSKGMEVTHGLLIANIPDWTAEMGKAETLEKLLVTLPETAIVGDAFLGASYSAHSGLPLAMRDYLRAYGGQERIRSVFHFYNFSKTLLANLQLKAVNIIKRMLEERAIATQKPCELTGLLSLSEDTRLLEILKEKTAIQFFGFRDDNYFVYACATLSGKSDWLAAIKLKAYLPEGSMTFFRGPENPTKQSIIIRHINEAPVSHCIDRFNENEQLYQVSVLGRFGEV